MPSVSLAANNRNVNVWYGSKDTVRISVVLPIFNAAYTLKQAIESLQNQTMHNLEIVCVDDCSTDESRAIIDTYAASDKRITIVEHEKNAGYGAAMNDGIAAARGEWIGILEPDDYVLTDMIKTLLVCADKAESIDIVKSPYIREYRTIEGTKRGDGPVVQLQCSYRHRIKPTKQPFTIKDPGVKHLLRHHPSIWSAIYRKSFLEQRHITFVEYPGSGWADNEFFYETLMQAEAIWYCDTPFYVYREETEEEALAFARREKTLPLDRWQSMMDIIERLGIQSCRTVAESHVMKGFTYLNGQLEANGYNDPVVLAEADKMFARMDNALVATVPNVALRLKQLYVERTGRSIPFRAGRYAWSLVREFCYTMRNNGIGYTLERLRGYWQKETQ